MVCGLSALLVRHRPNLIFIFMKLVKHSSEKLIYQSDTFSFCVAGLATVVGGFALLVPSLSSLMTCLKDKVCYQSSIHFQSLNILETSAGALAGLILVVLGTLLLMMTSTFRVIFDLAENQLVTQQNWIFFRKRVERRYSLLDIRTIDIDVLKGTGADPDTYQVVARLTSGESVPVDLTYSGDDSQPKKKAEEIRKFLSLP